MNRLMNFPTEFESTDHTGELAFFGMGCLMVGVLAIVIILMGVPSWRVAALDANFLLCAALVARRGWKCRQRRMRAAAQRTQLASLAVED